MPVIHIFNVFEAKNTAKNKLKKKNTKKLYIHNKTDIGL